MASLTLPHHSISPYQAYVNFLKVDRGRFASLPQWNRRNYHYIDRILQHVSCWTNATILAPRVNVVHELCLFKNMSMGIKAGRLRMMQSLIPKLMDEITTFDNAYQIPPAKTNISQELLTRPAATITTPVGYENVPTKKCYLPTDTTSANVHSPIITSPYVRARRAAKAEQVGMMSFHNMEDYKHFLRVGKHLVHSSPCIQVQNVTWRHSLTYEQWKTTKGKPDGCTAGSSWECRCRRWRVKKAKVGNNWLRKKPAQGGVHVLGRAPCGNTMPTS